MGAQFPFVLRFDYIDSPLPTQNVAKLVNDDYNKAVYINREIHISLLTLPIYCVVIIYKYQVKIQSVK